MARLAGNPEITANTLEIPYPPNDRMARDRINETDRKRDRRSDQVFMITTWTRGEIIGAIGLMCFTREHSRAKIGYWIGRPILEPGICYGGGLSGAGLRVPGDGSPPDLCLLPHPQQSHRARDGYGWHAT